MNTTRGSVHLWRFLEPAVGTEIQSRELVSRRAEDAAVKAYAPSSPGNDMLGFIHLPTAARGLPRVVELMEVRGDSMRNCHGYA